MKDTPPANTTRSAHLTHPKYRPDIDGLRAIAVLSVVAYHAFPMWIKGGFIGVDIFFVISGYLISTIIFDNLTRGSFSFTQFYSRRIKRIFPAVIVVLSSCTAFGWFVLLPDEYIQLGKHIAGGAGFIANFMLWGESGYFDSAAETKPLLHLWSLGIEEQFYIIWPLLLWAAWKQRLNWLTITVVVAAISFALNVKGLRGDVVATFYSPQTRFWELLIGSLLAYGTLYKQHALAAIELKLDGWLAQIIYAEAPKLDGALLRNIQSLLGLLLIATGVLLITKDRHFPGTWALLPTLGAALIISAGAHAWVNRAVLSHPVFVWFGLISYPLYLWHWPLLSFTGITHSEALTPLLSVTAVSASVVLAWLTYRLLEKPIRFGKHGKAKTIVLVLLMIVTGGAGYSVYRYHGFGFRFPEIIRELTDYSFDYDYGVGYRTSTCFLMTNQNYTAFTKCEDRISRTKKTIVIWGDSYAAHLYPGYHKVFDKEFNIVQRTISSCPPILGLQIEAIPFCKSTNDGIFEYIKESKPDRVVLSAVWFAYDWKNVAETIAQLKKAGVKDIDLIGPIPIWNDGLHKQLYLYYKKYRTIPYRMNFGLRTEVFVQLDVEMRELAKAQGANYISPKSILCDADGCITRFGDTGDTLSAWDNGHFTGVSSEYVVSKFPKPADESLPR